MNEAVAPPPLVAVPPALIAPDPQDVVRTWLLGALFVVALLAIFTVAAPVFVPIFMAMLLAAVLRSPVRGLIKLRLPQPIAAALVFVIFGGVIVSMTSIVYEPAAQWIEQFPRVIERVDDKLTAIRQTIKRANAAAQKIEDAAQLGSSTARPVELKSASLLERVFQHSRILLVQIAVVVVLSFFMLANSKPILPNRLVASFGPSGRRLRSSLQEIERQMSRYMGAVALTNLGVGLLTGIAMYFWGMPNPILWAAVAALLGFIPYVGPIVTAGAIASAAFLTFDDWPHILAPAATFLVIHIAESEIVTPLIIGRIMTLHPVTIFVSVLVWGWMWGIAGAFLAVPILVTCAIVGRNVLITEKQSLSEVMFQMNWNALVPGEGSLETVKAEVANGK